MWHPWIEIPNDSPVMGIAVAFENSTTISRILIFGPCCFIQLIIPQFCGRLKNLLYDKHVRVALQYYNGFKIQKKIDRFISKYLLRFQLSKTK